MTRAPQDSLPDDVPEPWSRTGEVLDGKFRIEEVLGRGGMGVVVAAHHLDLDEPVALKFLLPDATSNRTAIERFLREARASAKLKSPHITRVFDVGRTADNTPYIVMERLRGEDLSSRMRSRPLAIAEAVRIVLEVCEPLEEAHASGIIHRDLKPQNIFLARAGSKSTVKLLDFGISRAVMDENDLTHANEFLGTPHFMAPEQFDDPRSASARSDIYSLGACLYTMLTQRPPFFGGDLVALCTKVMSEPHVSVRERRPEVSPELASVIDRCLAKDPRDRFASARALRTALEPFAGEVPTAHVDDDTILAMQEGRLAGPKLAAVEAHLSGCEECMALVAIAGPSQARSNAPRPTYGANDVTVTGVGMPRAGVPGARTIGDDTATIATPRGMSARGMATLISNENATLSGETAAISGLSVGGVASAIPPAAFGTLASGPRTDAPAPPRNTALVALAAMLVVALVGVGGVVVFKRSGPATPAAAVAPPAAPPDPTPASAPAPTASEAPAGVEPPPLASVATATAPKPVKIPTARPKHTAATPTTKVGEIPNER